MLINRRNAMMAGGLSAKSYVQDGLVAMWDGIENAGWGVHDPNATVWQDLSGNNHNLELKNGAHFDVNSLITANRNSVSALLNYRLPWATIEVCAFYDASRNSSSMVCFGNSTDDARILVCAPVEIQTYNRNYFVRFSKAVPAKSTWAGVHDGTSHVGYVNGKVPDGQVLDNSWGTRNGNFGLSGTSNYSNYNFVGNYYCVRLHSRALTAAEVAANYAVDKARFNLPDAT